MCDDVVAIGLGPPGVEVTSHGTTALRVAGKACRGFAPTLTPSSWLALLARKRVPGYR
jgi:hypothetical protein